MNLLVEGEGGKRTMGVKGRKRQLSKRIQRKAFLQKHVMAREQATSLATSSILTLIYMFLLFSSFGHPPSSHEILGDEGILKV